MSLSWADFGDEEVDEEAEEEPATTEQAVELDSDLVIDQVQVSRRRLGRGTYGTVYAGVWHGAPVAVKELTSLAPGERGVFLSAFLSEWKTLRGLRHPFLVHLLGVLEEDRQHPQCVSLVMERMYSTLRRRSQTQPYLSDGTAVRLCGEVLCAIVYLHSKGITHGALTGNNVLLTRGAEPTAKLADLGLASAFISGASPGEEPTPRLAALRFAPSRYTRLFLPPEQVDGSAGQQQDLAADIFSYGVVVLSTCVHQDPSCEAEPRMVQLSDSNGTVRLRSEVERRSHDLSNLPEDHPMRGIITACLKNDPLDRPKGPDLVHSLENLPASRTGPGSLSSSPVKEYTDTEIRTISTGPLHGVEGPGESDVDRQNAGQPQCTQLGESKSQRLQAAKTKAAQAKGADPLGYIDPQVLGIKLKLDKAEKQASQAEQRMLAAQEKARLADQRAQAAQEKLQHLKVLKEKLDYAEGRLQLADSRADASENALRAERRCAQASEDRARWLHERLVAAEKQLLQAEKRVAPRQKTNVQRLPSSSPLFDSFGEHPDRAIASYSNTESVASTSSAPRLGMSLGSPRVSSPLTAYSSSPYHAEVDPLSTSFGRAEASPSSLLFRSHSPIKKVMYPRNVDI